MARNGITRKDVFDAATELADGDGVVNIKTIRERLGDRGSFSTISRYLREWEASRGEEPTRDARPPASVERDALRFVQSLWRALLSALQRGGGQTDATARHLKQLDTRIDHSRQSINSVEHQCAAYAKRLEQLTREMGEKERALHRMETELAAAGRRLESLQRQESELAKRLSALSRRDGGK